MEADIAPAAARLEFERFSRSARRHSMSSDRASISSHGGLLSPPLAPTPEPAYIAASAASQIVTNDHDSHADSWLDQHGIEPSGETALVAPAALRLVNNFLDQLLFNFLSVSKSTSLAALRPAVTEVLKPKLAQEAIAGADQELHEYLGGDEDEEFVDQNGETPVIEWDLELVWKRTRLRSMVYSSLGDMEEEDEDYYMTQGHLNTPVSDPYSPNPDTVSPAVAIFLTSVLEFMGEQALIIAGQAAYHRVRAKHEKESRDGNNSPAEIAERVVVEEADVQKVALDRTLGRLWRGWKKRVRSSRSSHSMSPRLSHDSTPSLPSRCGSNLPNAVSGTHPIPPSTEVFSEDAYAATIPLPMSEDDVREIEIPGLVPLSDDENEGASVRNRQGKKRPKSLMIFPTPRALPTPTSSRPDTPTNVTSKSRKRSNSLPSPTQSAYAAQPTGRQTGQNELVTPPSDDKMASAEQKGVEPTTERGPAFESNAQEDGATEGETALAEQTKANPTIDEDERRAEFHEGMTEAAAGGAVAAAGLRIVTNGVEKSPPMADEFEDEEPQIMTSARISIGPRSPDFLPAQVQDPTGWRPPSVHSLRLIDVPSPRSPAGSRHGSTDALEHVHPRNGTPLSRTPSVRSVLATPEPHPRGASPVLRGNSPLLRNTSGMSMRAETHSTRESIAEVEEHDVDDKVSDHSTNNLSDEPTQGMNMTHMTTILAEPVETTAQALPAILAAQPKSNNRDIPIMPIKQAPMYAPTRTMDIGQPALAPLQEMTESTAETAIPTPHPAPGHVDRQTPAQSRQSPKIAASGHSAIRKISDGSSVGSEKYSSSRSASTERHRARNDSTSKLSTEFNKQGRAVHTSASSISSSSKLKVTRTSEDSMPSRGDKGQSFEQLMRSDQTIQYTLTPQNMREIEVCKATPGLRHVRTNA
jgi:hypothetical protein